MFGATDRTVRRWLSVHRRNPDIVALLPRQKGQRLGNRRLRPDAERLLGEVIDVWAARAERLPVSWIVEECRRRARSRRVEAPGRRAVDARLRDRGLDNLTLQRFAAKSDPAIANAHSKIRGPVRIDRQLHDLDFLLSQHTLNGGTDLPFVEHDGMRMEDAPARQHVRIERH
jgi:hypothetical protein